MPTYLYFNCANCLTLFERELRKSYYTQKHNSLSFCSSDCFYDFKSKKQLVECTNCKITSPKKASEIKKSKSGNHFCSRSCAAIQNNTHKTSGTRRSKFEKWVEQQLNILYPNLNIIYNGKEAIGSELDIFIPELKLSFEINGIFHYEPIYGNIQLSKIQTNDQNKFELCLKNKIELCIIDVSAMKYFKEQSSKKYLEIITNIINYKLTTK